MNKYFLLIASAYMLAFSACKKESSSHKTIIDTIKVNDTVKVNVDELDRPVGLTASKGLYGNRVIIAWTPIPKAKNYRLFKFDDSKQDYQLLKELADTTYTDQSITTPLAKVYYKVMVYNSSTAYSKFSDITYGYTTGQNYSKNLSFGSQGAGPGQFDFALHVEVDKNDNIYTSDEGNGRVQKFDKSGNYQGVFFSGRSTRAIAFLQNGNVVLTTLTQSTNPYIIIRDPQNNVVAQWGSYGTQDNQFQNIEEITVDDDQNIYIVDGISNKVRKYDQKGNLLLSFTGAIKTADQVQDAYPTGICYLNNKIFVTSPRNSLVRVFDKSGKYLSSWDAGSPSQAIKAKGNNLYIACSTYIVKTDETGSVQEKIGVGEFTSIISGIAVNSEGEIIVSDVYRARIVSFKHL